MGSSSLFPRSMAVAASAVAHLGFAAAIGGHAPSRAVRASVETEVPIDMTTSVSEAPPIRPVDRAVEPWTKPSPSGASHATHSHLYPVLPDHDEHPHDPMLVHLPIGGPPARSPPEVVQTTPQTARVEWVAPVAVAVASGGPAGMANEGTTETFSEGNVSSGARVLPHEPPQYPPAARDADVSGDVPLEIVVDTDGRVIDAFATSKIGYGLEETAVQAVRSCRFIPARRDGRPVRVRMRHVMQFRLE